MRRALDIRRFFRYARARLFYIGVWAHYQVYFARHLGDDPTGSGRAAAYAWMQVKRAMEEAGVTRKEVIATPFGGESPALPDPLCAVECEAVGGDNACTCVGREAAPFTGTPYDPNSEED